MIKFFRRIRQKMLSGNKFSKYSLYAIGEIILVVIGILIALQLNTWKENKQNRKIEKAYLNGIVTNLEQDISELSDMIKRDSIVFKAYTKILMPFKNPDINFFTPSFMKAIGDAQFTNSFDGNSIVFEDMKSSGKINYIQSDALRFSLFEYYNDSQKIKNEQNKNTILINQLKNEAFNDNLDLNSLIEGFLFKGDLSAQLDRLDLSFFQKSKNDISVKQFANRVSLMKGILRVNHFANNHLIDHARKLKALILDYLSGKEVDFTSELSKEIFTAIIQGDINTLNSLVSESSLNTCFKIEGSYAINYLSLSIENNAMKSLQYFVEKGANLELACYDKTPLMYAVKYGRFEMVKYLLEKGANINTVSVEGNTALDYAIKYKHPKIETYLRAYKKK